MKTLLFAFLLLLSAQVLPAQSSDATVLGARGPYGAVLVWDDNAAPPGARYRVERQVGDAWVQVHTSPLGLPATLAETKALFANDWDEMLSLFDVRTDEQLYQALRSFSGPTGFLALFDPEFGERVGRRFLDATAPEGNLSYRIVRDGVQRSEIGRVTVDAIMPPVEGPREVAAVIDSVTAQVTVRYRLSASPSAILYSVYRRDASGTLARVNERSIIPVAEEGAYDPNGWFEFLDPSAQLGETYLYFVSAYDLGWNESPRVAAPEPITLPFPLPLIPENVRIVPQEDRSLLLTWDPPLDEGATMAYRIRRGPPSSEILPWIDDLVLPATETSWLDDTIQPGVLVGYQVVAIGLDSSRYTASFPVYMDFAEEDAQVVTGLSAEPHPVGVQVQWDPQDEGVTFALVRYAAPDDSMGVQLGTFLPDHVRIDSLGAGVMAWYEVRTLSTAGRESDLSLRVMGQSGVPLPPGNPPGNLMLLGENPAVLMWEEPVGRFPRAFHVYRAHDLWQRVDPTVLTLMDSSAVAVNFYRVAALYGDVEVFADTVFTTRFNETFEVQSLEIDVVAGKAQLVWMGAPATRFIVFRWMDGGEPQAVAEVETDRVGMATFTDAASQPGQVVYMRLARADQPQLTSRTLFISIPSAGEYQDN